MWVKLPPIQAFWEEGEHALALHTHQEAAIVGQRGRKGQGRGSSEAGGPGGNRGRDRRALWTPQMKSPWRREMSGDQKPVCMRRKTAEVCKLRVFFAGLANP
eukprot:607931-Pelagomonas_calceolata.AAC.2